GRQDPAADSSRAPRSRLRPHRVAALQPLLRGAGNGPHARGAAGSRHAARPPRPADDVRRLQPGGRPGPPLRRRGPLPRGPGGSRLTVAEDATDTAAPPKTRFTSFRPLRHRQFALVWSAALVSNVGTWMQTIAVGVLVTEITHKAGWVGFVTAAAFLPIGVLSPIGGALADRVERRRFMLLTTIGETAFATGL